ncbi:MAG: hypothetical protein Q9185_003598 [Variospora sp. 1 TL-2023]
MFNTLWSRDNVKRERNYTLTRNLGWGAFAIAKSSHLINLGSSPSQPSLPPGSSNLEDGGSRRRFKRDWDPRAADQVTATTSMDDTGLLEQDKGFDVKELLKREHTVDLVEDEHLAPLKSEGRKRRAVVEATGSVARAMKRRDTN